VRPKLEDDPKRRESLMPRPAGDLRIDAALRGADYCYITTTGRVTGNPHTIEIWFGIEGSSLYVLAGGRYDADFVKNLRKRPGVSVRIGRRTFEAAARVVELPGEDALARRLLLEKYGPRYSGDLGDWGRDALPVAFDLRAGPRTKNREPRT
jgi:deazaflavin-dependent oxidoreductase (nitroreductase family)